MQAPGRKLLILSALLAACTLTGCAPEIGSDAWCEDMAEKPKGDWTANEALDYAEHCVFD